MSRFSGPSSMIGHDFIGDPVAAGPSLVFRDESSDLLKEKKRTHSDHAVQDFNDVYEKLLVAAREIAMQARLAALRMPTSEAALSRLAQAELTAGEIDSARES